MDLVEHKNNVSMYTAPEIIIFLQERKVFPATWNQEKLNKCDIWGIGIMTIIMITNYKNFDRKSIDY